MASNLLAMASNLIAMALASNPLAMASNKIEMASNLIEMPSDLLSSLSSEKQLKYQRCRDLMRLGYIPPCYQVFILGINMKQALLLTKKHGQPFAFGDRPEALVELRALFTHFDVRNQGWGRRAVGLRGTRKRLT